MSPKGGDSGRKTHDGFDVAPDVWALEIEGRLRSTTRGDLFFLFEKEHGPDCLARAMLLQELRHRTERCISSSNGHYLSMYYVRRHITSFERLSLAEVDVLV